MQDLAGKIVFITGTSTGFGKAIAENVLGRGGSVVATARDVTTLDGIVALDPSRVLAAPLDVTKPDQVASSVAAAEARFGRIDALINNAGYGLMSTLEEAEWSQIRHQFEVNLFGLIDVTRAVLPGMRARRSGLIVNLSSIAGASGFAGSAYYCASKFAVEGLSESLAEEVAPFGIHVTIVEPSAFRTEFFGRSLEETESVIPDYAPMAEMRRSMRARDGQQPGDPVKAATAIADLIVNPAPPRRLLVGSMAYKSVSKALQRRQDEAGASRAVAEGCDYQAA